MANKPGVSVEMIKAARAAAGLTQFQASEIIGAGHRTWQDWEQGKRNMPPAKFALFVLLTKG